MFLIRKNPRDVAFSWILNFTNSSEPKLIVYYFAKCL